MTDAERSVTRLEHVRPDLERVASVLWCTRGLDPGYAWDLAVSGDTAARMAGTAWEELYIATAELLALAAAHGWWPQRLDGELVAVPLAQWVAEGHPFTLKVPNAEIMLDRWGINPVVIDANSDNHFLPSASAGCPTSPR